MRFCSKLLLLALIGPSLLTADPALSREYSWHAHILDEEGLPVPYANVIISQLNTGGVSDIHGHVLLTNLPAGTFTVEISIIGYVNRSFDITIPQTTEDWQPIIMKPHVLEGQTVTVTVTGVPTDVLSSERTVTIIDEKSIQMKMGQSISETLSDVPGVQIMSNGHAVAKPVIRGMTNQRLVFIRDGIRQEAQQWGGHHTPEADILNVGRIEVLRGPMGLIFGSEALGGVIQLQSPKLQTLDEGGQRWRIAARSGYHGNSEQYFGSAAIQYARPHSALRLNLSGRNSGNYSIPGSGNFLVSQEGTAYRQTNIGMHLRLHQGIHDIELLAGRYWEEQTLIGEGHWHNTGGGPDGTEPWYHVLGSIISPTLHQNLTMKGRIILGKSWIEYDLGTQFNHRQGGPENSEPAVDLSSTTRGLNLRWRHLVQNKLPGTLGISIQHRDNRSQGTEILLPDYGQTSIGTYLYYRWNRSCFTYSGGIRLDGTGYDIRPTTFTQDYSVEEEQLLYLPVTSGSVGVVWHMPDAPYSAALNLGSGWRPPNPYELYINGVHHGDWKIEIGDPDLKPESSLNTDLIFRHVTNIHSGELSFFYNRMRRYIISSPTGAVDPISHIPIYQIIQSDARILGMEMRLQHMLGKKMRWNIGWDVLRGELLSDISDTDGDGKVETALPGINPPRALIGFSFLDGKAFRFCDIEFNVNYEYVWAQKNLAEFENILDDGYGNHYFLDPTSHQIVNISASTNLDIDGRTVVLAVGINNLFNEQYYDHLSRYKGIAYNQGFDLHGSIQVVFD